MDPPSPPLQWGEMSEQGIIAMAQWMGCNVYTIDQGLSYRLLNRQPIAIGPRRVPRGRFMDNPPAKLESPGIIPGVSVLAAQIDGNLKSKAVLNKLPNHELPCGPTAVIIDTFSFIIKKHIESLNRQVWSFHIQARNDDWVEFPKDPDAWSITWADCKKLIMVTGPIYSTITDEEVVAKDVPTGRLIQNAMLPLFADGTLIRNPWTREASYAKFNSRKVPVIVAQVPSNPKPASNGLNLDDSIPSADTQKKSKSKKSKKYKKPKKSKIVDESNTKSTNIVSDPNLSNLKSASIDSGLRKTVPTIIVSNHSDLSNNKASSDNSILNKPNASSVTSNSSAAKSKKSKKKVQFSEPNASDDSIISNDSICWILSNQELSSIDHHLSQKVPSSNDSKPSKSTNSLGESNLNNLNTPTEKPKKSKKKSKKATESKTRNENADPNDSNFSDPISFSEAINLSDLATSSTKSEESKKREKMPKRAEDTNKVNPNGSNFAPYQGVFSDMTVATDTSDPHLYPDIFKLRDDTVGIDATISEYFRFSLIKPANFMAVMNLTAILPDEHIATFIMMLMIWNLDWEI